MRLKPKLFLKRPITHKAPRRKRVLVYKKTIVGQRLPVVRSRNVSKQKSPARPRLFSTGILRRNPNTSFALVDVMNLGSGTISDIAVQVFDWSSGTAVPLNVSPCELPVCKVTLSPRTSDFLYADVSGVEFKYEVRISLPRHANVLLNVTGVSAAPFTPQVGDNVLQHNLVEIRN
ncbi:hypothetical protein ACHHV8_34645 [Paenibacillus sp. TAB 01]|uniref:hypothetical protein n=1 Tax=Paenibacillus sp. TAB 01 TaxID=3368988 RepID=UPI003750A36B